MTSTDSQRRPYKVWSCDRQTRKAVVVTTLQDLKQQGGERLGYSGLADVTVVLEIDGTEVEDDNYFQTLVKDTIFLLLRPNEKWLPPGVEALRAGRSDDVDGPSRINILESRDPSELMKALKQDLTNMLLLNDEQLELISGAPVPEDYPGRQEWKLLQESCDRLLVQHRELSNAREILGLLETIVPGRNDQVDSGPMEEPNPQELRSALMEASSLLWSSSEAGGRTDRAVRRRSKRTKPY